MVHLFLETSVKLLSWVALSTPFAPFMGDVFIWWNFISCKAAVAKDHGKADERNGEERTRDGTFMSPGHGLCRMSTCPSKGFGNSGPVVWKWLYLQNTNYLSN